MIDIRSHRLLLRGARVGYNIVRATVWPIGVGARSLKEAQIVRIVNYPPRIGVFKVNAK